MAKEILDSKPMKAGISAAKPEYAHLKWTRQYNDHS